MSLSPGSKLEPGDIDEVFTWALSDARKSHRSGTTRAQRAKAGGRENLYSLADAIDSGRAE